MSAIQQLLTDHIDIWTAADTEKKSGRGRSSGNAANVYGIKKLRELILELAVRGKLVPQDANDEPASELLKRIQAEKAKLIAEGKIKKKIPPTPLLQRGGLTSPAPVTSNAPPFVKGGLGGISEEEQPFALPQGWEWARVSHVGHDWGQKKPDSDFTYIEVSAIDSKYGVVSTPELVKPENAPSRARKLVKKDTVIYSTVRPYLLNIAVIEQDFSPEPIASTAFAVVHPFCSMPSRYFLYFFRSPVFVRYVESVQMGIAYPAINDGQFFSGLISLPPLAEQYRIVAKVDELMGLCDQLETQHNAAAEAHEKLVSHLLGTLTQSQSAEDFSVNWQRIAAHFDTLFITEASIDALKQTLLQLAVMGKLVPQDPNDEPASELLQRINQELCNIIGTPCLPKLHRDKSTFDPIDFHCDIPKSWAWCELQDIAIFENGKAHEQFVTEKEAYVLVNSSFVSNNGDKVKYVSDRLSPLSKDDIVIVMSDVPSGRALVRCFLVMDNDKFTLNQRIGALKTGSTMSKRYLLIVLDRNKYYLAYDDGKKQTNLKKIQILSCPIPLPPISEQHRIVAKVDELMALCDQLKSRITEANQLQQKLADVVVEQAIS